MRLTILAALIGLLTLWSCSENQGRLSDTAEALLERLDAEIAAAPRYEALKEARIDSLRRMLAHSADPGRKFEAVDGLIAEYDAYKADSAIHYVNMNLNAPKARDPRVRNRLLLRKADLYSHAGLFPDAISLMDSIDHAALDADSRKQYFANYCALYQYIVEYNTDFDPALQMEYERRRHQYADSIRMSTDSMSLVHIIYVMPELAESGRVEEAAARLRESMEGYAEGTREYSILASILAYVYKVNGRPEEYMEYLTRSAVSDIKGAVKENMSFRELATNMFEAGNVERANVYLKKSIADANFFSARMRNAQSLKMLPMIDESYDALQRKLYRRLQYLIAAVSLLAAGVIAALYFIRRQYRRLKAANGQVTLINAELSCLSEQLGHANADLEEKNRALNESNVIREQYTGLFMGYSAAAINALQSYHQSVRLMVNQGLTKAALQKKLESSEFIDSTIKEFYAKFDEAILRIYPDFPDKVNALLKPGEEIRLKPGELLNTELRIQALIRIGISENAKIAEFLRCSITTIYTYRSKLRRRALNPEGFEEAVFRIS